VAAILIVALTTSMTVMRSQASDVGIGLPKGVALKSVIVIPLRALKTSQDRALVASLQGLVAKHSPEQIFIDDGGPNTTWKDYLVSRYGIRLNHSYATLPLLVAHFPSIRQRLHPL
jgi:hypothetical protein